MFRLDHEAENAVRQRLGVLDADAFLARLEQLSFDIAGPLGQLYGSVTDTTRLVTGLVMDALEAAAARPALLRLLDRRREIDPGWFQRSRMIGYVCYADRFAGSLRGVRHHLDYLAELGVTYLHLMPLLQPRDGDSDGGYAVADTLGAHDRYQPECDLAYDNQLMVMLWSTLATRDARLAGHALSRRRAPRPDRVGFLPALPR